MAMVSAVKGETETGGWTFPFQAGAGLVNGLTAEGSFVSKGAAGGAAGIGGTGCVSSGEGGSI